VDGGVGLFVVASVQANHQAVDLQDQPRGHASGSIGPPERGFDTRGKVIAIASLSAPGPQHGTSHCSDEARKTV
jgi:hypothetical protein